MDTVNVLSARNISHGELKEWIHKYISPSFKDIRELGTGIEFCLGIFVLFPSTISLKKVRVGGLSQYDKYHNFKCLQAAFNALELNKVIPMVEMMKMTFRENFYFGCWFKTFFEANYDGQPYDIKRLHLQCKRKHTNIYEKNPNFPVKFNVPVKVSPRTTVSGPIKRQIMNTTDRNCARASLLNRQEKTLIPEETNIHQLCLPSVKTKKSKSLKEILACKSDTDIASKKRKCPPLAGGCVTQADLCRSLNEAMAQIRKALITVRAGLYQRVADDLDKQHKEQCELGKPSNRIEF